MANKRYSKRKKVEPAVLTMRFPVQTVPGSGQATSYIDLSQCASLLNRRFYRQGINWAVARIKLLTSSGDPANRAEGYVQISKLPTTWVMSNAWEKGFRAWQRMNNEALDEAESVRPRFLDFKIYADQTHHLAGFGANLLPNFANAGEWESSKYRIPIGPANPGDTTDREIIATGASFPGAGASGVNAVSLIEGYAASRSLPNIKDPNTPDDADDATGTTPENWMSALFNDGTEQTQAVIADLIAENNQAPYPFEGGEIPGAPGTYWTDTMYPGGANNQVGLQFHDDEYITSTTVGGTTRLRGGQFPCGLMKVFVQNTTPGDLSIDYTIQVDLVPGHHRGYLCEPMTEM